MPAGTQLERGALGVQTPPPSPPAPLPAPWLPSEEREAGLTLGKCSLLAYVEVLPWTARPRSPLWGWKLGGGGAEWESLGLGGGSGGPSRPPQWVLWPAGARVLQAEGKGSSGGAGGAPQAGATLVPGVARGQRVGVGGWGDRGRSERAPHPPAVRVTCANCATSGLAVGRELLGGEWGGGSAPLPTAAAGEGPAALPQPLPHSAPSPSL